MYVVYDDNIQNDPIIHYQAYIETYLEDDIVDDDVALPDHLKMAEDEV